jgi:hypothetical protein
LRNTLREAVDEAVSRFSGATEEIRVTAGSIRQELSDTRDELKKGAFDLPEETRESAAAMRRAVAQQIEALQELSSLVSKSTQTIDANVSPSTLTAPANPAAPPARERVATAADIGAQELRPTRDAVSESNDDARWVSNLIKGADTQEAPAQQAQPTRQPRKPQHVVESLNSLSVDIARAIDHDASVELWQRYQRGERDIFTRRLYTIKGQKTFDDIQSKYAREPEFRKAVDRYMTDFEKLLSDVSRNDPSNVIGQSYLTSDTGKVYTMLAHASGRLK